MFVIGVDSRKGSHTTAALDEEERVHGELRRPGGQVGTTDQVQRDRLCTLTAGSSDQVTPGPTSTLRPRDGLVRRA